MNDKEIELENAAEKACEAANVTAEGADDNPAASTAEGETPTVQTNEKENGLLMGKFKNSEELEKAYAALQKEFTRRSQRLKELSSAKSSSAKEDNVQKIEAETDGGGRDWRVEVDEFFERTPSAKSYAKQIAERIRLNPSLKERRDTLSAAYAEALEAEYRTPEELLKDGQFLKEYVLKNEDVKNAVVKAYLSEVRESTPPRVILNAGRSAVAPPQKPRTIDDAGKLFLKNNK